MLRLAATRVSGLRLRSTRRSVHSFVPFDHGQQVATFFAQNGAPGSTPLVLLGGTAQTINGWIGHHSPLSRDRTFLQYELRGQGRTTLSVDDCSLLQHVADFERLVQELGLKTPVDVVSI